MNTASYWWVNNNRTFKHEFRGGYLWSPINNANGGPSHYYNNMTLVQPGDIVFSYANTAIKAVGIATGRAALLPKPSEFGVAGATWGDDGWMVSVEFQLLLPPLRTKDHMNILKQTLPHKYSPIQANGNGNQTAYLCSVPEQMAEELSKLLGNRLEDSLGRLLEKLGPNPQDQDVGEDRVDDAIKNRTDIGPTEKQQLIKARSGQGLYRKNLEFIESKCRVTGVLDLKHLRASHIKPWRASNDTEKLDGNNGLLLSPHVDHLFDRGFISFEDNGKMLVSPHLSPCVLPAWNIAPMLHAGRFKIEQCEYLEFHRERIFKK